MAASAVPSGRVACPACGSAEERPVVSLRAVPVMVGALWDTREEAIAAATGDIDLVACPRCSMLRNAAYDDGRLDYEANYDNSLHFSPTFQAYADDLAERLVERHGLRGRSVVEIGSGKGDFLRALCRIGGNRGWGYDPTYDGEQGDVDEDVTFVAEYFDGELPAVPDLACARHVLEHFEQPARLLDTLRAAASDRTVLYVEVPDAAYVLTPGGLWDLIYPHIGYFTATALTHLVTACGFAPTAVDTTFGDQYLWVEARAATAPAPPSLPPRDRVDEVLKQADGFAELHRDTLGRWARRLAEAHAAGARVALWGAGAKGVTFLNVVPGGDTIADVVDVNPRKRGRHVPGTGQQVVAPHDLVTSPPDLVLIMNPNYEDEIRTTLTDAGLTPTVAVV